MINYKNISCLFCILHASAFGSNILAQSGKMNRGFLSDYVFKGNHLLFTSGVMYASKAKIKNLSGDYPFSASRSFSLMIALKYRINFNNKYSLTTGAEAGLIGRNYAVSFKKNDFSPPLTDDRSFSGKDTYYADLVFSLPILVEKRILYADKKFCYGGAGFRMNFSTGADFDRSSITLENTNGGFYAVTKVNTVANNDAKPWISFPLNVGHGWLLKNNNLIQLEISSNISFTKYVDGEYEITIPSKPLTKGSYSSTGSYIGLSFSYVFTSANYRIRKAFEKMRENK